ncbi:MAG: TRAP transporter TatT component family protein [Methylococcaceae bacterium]
MSRATDDFGKNLSKAILNHNEPETIAEAIPAYLLLLETLIVNEPDNETLLSSAATLYGAYTSLLSDDGDRKKQLSSQALNFAMRSACIHDQLLCQLNDQTYERFEAIIEQTNSDDIATLYLVGSAWAQWIQAHSSDWNAIAQLAQVKLTMTRVIELDNRYKGGNAHVYLGVLATILPPALGGTPEIGKQHFESALQLSEGKSLMVKVVYAKQYARMMFERELHDSLLNAVMSAQLEQPDLTLMNALAKKQARDLLDSADEYF